MLFFCATGMFIYTFNYIIFTYHFFILYLLNTYRCDSEVPFEDTGLKKVPTGDWFCAACVSKPAGKGKGKAAAPAGKRKAEPVAPVAEPKGKRGKAAAAVEETEEEVEMALLCDG